MNLVHGTNLSVSADFERRQAIADRMLRSIAAAGYDRIETPVLDLVELHERKSGAAVTTRIVEIEEIGDQGPICLRPELTVGVVRTVVETGSLVSGPVRLCVVGSVFRRDDGGLRGIEQIGAELIGDPSVEADAEAIALAVNALEMAGVGQTSIRLGDVGLILDAVAEAGLPQEARKAIVETLADSAAAGKGLSQVESDLEHWGDWLDDYGGPSGWGGGGGSSEIEMRRLYHHLVGPVVGRRSETEILTRLRRKWDLAETLPGALRKAANVVHELGSLNGPADTVLDSLGHLPIGPSAEKARHRMARLVELLGSRFGIGGDRIRIDLGVARGIGFYSGLVFGIHADRAGGAELAGGGRYDGLATVLGMAEGCDAGVGFAIGLDRVIDSVGQHHANPGGVQTFVISPTDGDAGSESAAKTLTGKLRQLGVRARLATPSDSAVAAGSVSVEVNSKGDWRCTDPEASEFLMGLSDKDI